MKPTVISSQLTKRRPGLKPGQRHSGQFKPGYDPRRNLHGPFTSPERRTFMEACREKTENALAVLEAAMNDESASWKDRMTAASLLIEHGHGKPVDRKVVAEMGGNICEKAAIQLSDEELMQIAAGGVVTRLPPGES